VESRGGCFATDWDLNVANPGELRKISVTDCRFPCYSGVFEGYGETVRT